VCGCVLSSVSTWALSSQMIVQSQAGCKPSRGMGRLSDFDVEPSLSRWRTRHRALRRIQKYTTYPVIGGAGIPLNDPFDQGHYHADGEQACYCARDRRADHAIPSRVVPELGWRLVGAGIPRMSPNSAAFTSGISCHEYPRDGCSSSKKEIKEESRSDPVTVDLMSLQNRIKDKYNRDDDSQGTNKDSIREQCKARGPIVIARFGGRSRNARRGRKSSFGLLPTMRDSLPLHTVSEP